MSSKSDNENNPIPTTAEAGEVDFGDYLETMRKEMHERVDSQTEVMKALVDRMAGGDTRVNFCSLVDCPLRKKFSETLEHAIRVLEQTRSSFKSKTLESLRRDLTEVLCSI